MLKKLIGNIQKFDDELEAGSLKAIDLSLIKEIVCGLSQFADILCQNLPDSVGNAKVIICDVSKLLDDACDAIPEGGLES